MTKTLRMLILVVGVLLFAPDDARASDSGVGGVDHVGLTVTNLVASEAFFVGALGFTVSDRAPDYPASFLTNGQTLITLWRAVDPANAAPFNRKSSVGLHHLAFQVGSFAELDALHTRLKGEADVTIEFAPELLGSGPARHMMIREPSGNRLEFIHRPTGLS